ncbi:hypothetical protein [Streptomyces phaeochromogenes]|uniref:hypothetical protein n=1 Tax=Streptomyces phaeochromogenes TaxID=1923 RepID=UPI003723604B
MFGRVQVELGRDLLVALEAAQESSDIYRRQARAEPGAYDSDLRTDMEVQADILNRLDRAEENNRIRPPQP